MAEPHEKIEPHWLLYTNTGLNIKMLFNQFVGLRYWDWRALPSSRFHQCILQRLACNCCSYAAGQVAFCKHSSLATLFCMPSEKELLMTANLHFLLPLETSDVAQFSTSIEL